MPEGDTLHRTAATLRRALAGQILTAFESPLPALSRHAGSLTGRTVSDVSAHGKNLRIVFDDGRVLYSHMKMTGSWHLYRPDEPWRKPARRARAVLRTGDSVAVCFSAPVVELLTPAQERAHPVLSRLGPDLLAPDPDLAEARRRLRAAGDMPLGEAILDQGRVAGIGNVYKSEVLFLCGLDPFAPVSAASDDDLDRLLATARGLMVRNLDGGPRRTRFSLDPGRGWVYGRSGRPCRHCGARVAMRRQGATARSTYFCPACQAPAKEAH